MDPKHKQEMKMKDKALSRAVQRLKEKLEENQASELYRDSQGEVFDPDFHVWDKEKGEPVYNKGGEFRRRPQQPICMVFN